MGECVCPKPQSPWLMALCSLITYPPISRTSGSADVSHLTHRCVTMFQLGSAQSACGSCFHVQAASYCRFHCQLRQSHKTGFFTGTHSAALWGCLHRAFVGALVFCSETSQCLIYGIKSSLSISLHLYVYISISGLQAQSTFSTSSVSVNNCTNLCLAVVDQLYATGARILALGTCFPHPTMDHTQQKDTRRDRVAKGWTGHFARSAFLVEMLSIDDNAYLDLVWEVVKARVTASTESRHAVVIQKLNNPESL